MSKAIKHTYYFTYPPEVVWKYLTTSELIEQWLMKNTFKLEADYEFTFSTMPLPQFNFDGNVFCKVLEIVPLEKLSYSWAGGPAPGQITLESVVTWTLVPTDNGTELHLEHRGFKEENTPIFNAMNHGWQEILPKIDKLIKAEKDGNA
ncbi:uncharacterized protein YndB with AHSA1/START domain [Mucilaginibacter yixingensis]|uniref:Uncharacterized protein YndB with AHSA1/START domain n=1 Tax=Mucilaginibacter yixingensis TaxID=1295612 RepID=A0A2T5JG63_9SPHI|nr:SRPBCC domain-containing protein [Mucilaginibacter yixingensis]PTR01384.1 uncharacterized protein YndB with AHSA1/START domain [Mucilaginibacter yixingensis]